MSDRLILFAPEVFKNPHPTFAEARRRGPCPVEPGTFWAISRYDDVLTVLKDARRFSSKGYGGRPRPAWMTENPFGERMLTELDPPEHTRLRQVVSRAFSAGAVARMEPWIRKAAAALAEEVVAAGEVDFVPAFALRLPAAVICRLVGFDLSLRERFKRWTDDTAVLLGPHSDDQIPRLRATVAEMAQYLTELIEARRRAPAEDLVSVLLQSESEGALTAEELMGFVRLLLLAGLETTVNLLSNTMVVLSDRRDVLARVLKDRGLVPALVEEVLRYETPAPLVFRRALEEVALSGVTVPAGTSLVVLLGAAHRDERRFAQPDVFDLDRADRGNLPFGAGSHFCLGAQLARLEARVALEELFSRIRGFSRKSPEVAWLPSINVHGPVALPLRFERA